MALLITAIQQTRRGRFALFSADGFLFSIDAETLAKWDIHEGSSLTNEELSLLKDQSETRKAKDAALRYLSLRAYGEQELYEKLCNKYDEQSAAAAVATMCELQLLNDEVFTLEKAKGMAQRGKSSFEIKQKLYALGVNRQLVEQVLANVEIDDYATAQALLQKSYLTKLQQGERQKVMAALARRGYSYQVIKEAIEAVQNEFMPDDTKEEME